MEELLEMNTKERERFKIIIRLKKKEHLANKQLLNSSGIGIRQLQRLLFKYRKYSKPVSIYTDRLAVFETNRKTDKDYKETQFQRALSELGIKLILANSPQA